MSQPSFPLTPPADWFNAPEPPGPQPIEITPDGQITGHLALWDQCHTGFSECVSPPKGDSFENFHVGQLEADDGSMRSVGKIVYSTKHATLDLVAASASRHYDDTGHVGAYVTARNGRFGIWMSGAVKHDISAEGLATMRANPPSGDWRGIKNRLSLIAALAVPIPGFPVARAMAASGALILDGVHDDDVEEEREERSKEFLRRRATIAARIAG